jgi:hypothetical protein
VTVSPTVRDVSTVLDMTNKERQKGATEKSDRKERQKRATEKSDRKERQKRATEKSDR